MVALKTFYNLSPERQQEIVQVCLEEFSLHEYEEASLTEIIKKLGLAKGSFYRYFEHKQSLYLFLLDYCLQTRLRHDAGLVQEDGEDFFALYTLHFEARLRFEKEYPLESAFLQTLLRQKTTPEIEVIQTAARKKIVGLMKPKIVEGIRKRKIRSDLDPGMLAFLMAQTQFLISDYIQYKYQDSSGKRPGKTSKVPQKEIVQAGKAIIEVFKTGFQLKR